MKKMVKIIKINVLKKKIKIGRISENKEISERNLIVPRLMQYWRILRLSFTYYFIYAPLALSTRCTVPSGQYTFSPSDTLR
jgi:hypothetical protein